MSKWMFERFDRDIWTTSEQYDTREEAIEEGRKFFTEEDPQSYFLVGRTEQITFGVNVDSIIDQLQENAYEQAGEVTEGWLERLPSDTRSRLEDKMNEVLFKWLEEENLEARFFTIVDSEEVCTEEDSNQ